MMCRPQTLFRCVHPDAAEPRWRHTVAIAAVSAHSARGQAQWRTSVFFKSTSRALEATTGSARSAPASSRRRRATRLPQETSSSCPCPVAYQSPSCNPPPGMASRFVPSHRIPIGLRLRLKAQPSASRRRASPAAAQFGPCKNQMLLVAPLGYAHLPVDCTGCQGGIESFLDRAVVGATSAVDSEHDGVRRQRRVENQSNGPGPLQARPEVRARRCIVAGTTLRRRCGPWGLVGRAAFLML